MQRRKFLAGAGMGSAAALASLSAHAQSGLPTLNWRLTSGFPKSLDTLYGNAEYIARRIGELTDGKFQIKVFAAGEIVPSLQVLDSVQNGTVEMGQVPLYWFFGKNPAFAFGTAVPFGMTARQQFAWWHQAGGLTMYREFMKGFNVYNLPCANTGTQMGGWFRKEIKSVADLKGLKFRVGGVAGVILQKLGVVPQQIAPGDIYPALEKGVIDAAEWVGPHDDERLGLSKVAKFYYYPGWWEGGAESHALVNLAKWNELPKFYQLAIEVACNEAYWMTQAKYDAVNPVALKRLVAAGGQLRPFPRAVMEACEKAAYETYAEFGQKSAEWKKIYEPWKKFRDEQFTWFRVAENTYENYMYQSKIGRG